MKVNKTDANDAEGLAHLVRAGWYREVRVKGRGAMLTKALLGARSHLLSISPTKIVDGQCAIRQRSQLRNRLSRNDFVQADRDQPTQCSQKYWPPH
jgi:hypothetical protein